MRTRLRVIQWSFVCVLAGASIAEAQISPGDKAAAEALFDQGLELMRSGKYSEACTKLEQSQSIDHGIGNMLYLAECYEKAGRTASAWALFRQAASEAAAARQNERAEAGRRRAASLEPMLSKLVINVADASPAGLEILRNAAPVASSVWGVAVPVDPGEHQVEARAPGYTSWSATLRVDPNGSTATVLVPALVKAEAGVTPPSETPSQPGLEPQLVPRPAAVATGAVAAIDTRSQGGETQRVVGLVVGGAGVVALGVGAVFGVNAISKNDDAGHYCPGGGARCTDPRGVTLTHDAQSAARLANVLVIGGAAVAAAGVAIYLFAPSDKERTIALSTDGRTTGLVLEGVF